MTSQTAQLYDRLRAAILSLDLPPGERPTERALEASFDASRTPVRAALLRLGAEGLVERGARGFTVARIDIREVGHLAELREAVEVAAVRLAVSRASDAEVSALSELLDSGRHRDEDEVLAEGNAFHEQLAALSGNPLLADAVRGAMTRLARTRWLEARTESARELAWHEHRAILDAVAHRESALAERLVAEHIRDTNARLLAVLHGDGVGILSKIGILRVSPDS